MNKRLLVLLGTATLLGACATNTNREQYGAIDVTAAAPGIEKPVTTADGWSVKYDRFVVSVAAVTVAASDSLVVTASSTPQLVDLLAPPPQVLLTATNRRAKLWDDVSFQIAPAVTSEETPITLGAGITEADSETMTKGGFAIYVEGKATKGAITKTMKWGFTTDTTFAECEGDQDGERVRGVIIPSQNAVSVDLAFRGDVLLSDDLGAPGAAFRFNALAAADADGDGEITLEELAATTLESARGTGGSYGTADQADVADLGAFTAALTRRVLASYRGKGTCTSRPTEAEPAAP